MTEAKMNTNTETWVTNMSTNTNGRGEENNTKMMMKVETFVRTQGQEHE